jgi:ADP-ribose pyrophosphatase YjhB (NUDIX family)
MPASDYPLSPEEFKDIYSKVPRLTVEVVMTGPNGILLTKRNIEPCKGLWHLPGGTVLFGESLVAAVKRVARRELGVAVNACQMIGYIEYPSHYLHGLDHPMGMVFEVRDYSGTIQTNAEAQGSDWFWDLPTGVHDGQRQFLVQTLRRLRVT